VLPATASRFSRRLGQRRVGSGRASPQTRGTPLQLPRTRSDVRDCEAGRLPAQARQIPGVLRSCCWRRFAAASSSGGTIASVGSKATPAAGNACETSVTDRQQVNDNLRGLTRSLPPAARAPPARRRSRQPSPAGAGSGPEHPPTAPRPPPETAHPLVPPPHRITPYDAQPPRGRRGRRRRPSWTTCPSSDRRADPVQLQAPQAWVLR